MTASVEVTIDAVDADPVVSFWQAALGYDRLYERDPYIVLGPPPGDARPRLVIQRVPITSRLSVVTVDPTSDGSLEMAQQPAGLQMAGNRCVSRRDGPSMDDVHGFLRRLRMRARDGPPAA
jgi:hypothetical protein